MTSNMVLIDSLTKCRIILWSEYNCISISTILIVVAVSGILLIVLAILMRLSTKSEHKTMNPTHKTKSNNRKL